MNNIESKVLHTATVLKKAEAMKSEYLRADLWLKQELETADPVRKAELLAAQEKVAQGLQAVEEQLETFQQQMEALPQGRAVLEVARTLNSFNL